MDGSFYRRNKTIIYISSVILFSITLIRAYSYKNFLSKITINDGFKSAISVKNDKNICVGNKQNINCQMDLLRELKEIKITLLF